MKKQIPIINDKSVFTITLSTPISLFQPYLQILSNCDGAIYVRGDSMYPLVKSGDMISFKMLNKIDNLISGEMYVVDFEIEGDDFLVLKYVQ